MRISTCLFKFVLQKGVANKSSKTTSTLCEAKMNETKLTIVSLRTNCLPFSAPGLKMTCPPPKSGWEMNLWTRSGSSFCAGLPAGFEKFNMPGTWKISGRKTSWLIALRFFGKMKKTIWDAHELKVDSVGVYTIITNFIEMWKEKHNQQNMAK